MSNCYSNVFCLGQTPEPTLPPTVCDGSGVLYSWGDNTDGQLGDGTHYSRCYPTLIGVDFIKLSVGENHSSFSAIKSNGDLYSWGIDYFENNNTPTFVGSDYCETSSGAFVGFGIKNNGDLYVWAGGGGGKSSGLSIDKFDSNGRVKDPPALVGSNYLKIAAGEGFTFGLKNNGDLYYWGFVFGSGGAPLGTLNPADSNYNPPKIIQLPKQVETNVSKIFAGEGCSFIKTNGDAYVFYAFDVDNSIPRFFKVGSDYKVLTTASGLGLELGRVVLYGIKNNGDLYSISFFSNWHLYEGYTFQGVTIPFNPTEPIETLIGSDYKDVQRHEIGVIALQNNGDLYGWETVLPAYEHVNIDGKWIISWCPWRGSFRYTADNPYLIGSGFSEIAAGDWAIYGIKNCSTPTPTESPTTMPTPTPTPTPTETI